MFGPQPILLGAAPAEDGGAGPWTCALRPTDDTLSRSPSSWRLRVRPLAGGPIAARGILSAADGASDDEPAEASDG